MIFRRSADVIARREGDRTLVFHQKTGWICILNPSSTFIWETFTGDLSPEEIADRIRQKFTVAEDATDGRQLLGLVEKHLNLMHKAQLLDIVEV